MTICSVYFKVDDMDSICRLVGMVALTLADSGVLQLNVEGTADEIEAAIEMLISKYSTEIPKSTIGIGKLVVYSTIFIKLISYQRLLDAPNINFQ